MLGIVIVILTSATTVSVMTVKPAKPKGTIVFTIDYGQRSVKEAINNYIRQGYIVKSVAGTSRYEDTWIVVMEKY
jgi:hypothetical protein